MSENWEGISRLQVAMRWVAWIDCGDADETAEINESCAAKRFEAELDALPPNSRLIHKGCSEYPHSLRSWSEAPPFLYVMGELSSKEHVAMVGARDTDGEGLRIGSELAAQIAGRAEVVSGGAKGMDAACHRGAMRVGRTTVVLPSSIDRMSPASNRPLFAKVLAQGGAVLSELPIGTTVRKHHFRRRNQLLVALCDKVVVVRAKTSGGTMMTAQITSNAGKRLFAVPGSPEDQCALGCLDLIRSGAAEPAWRPEHIVDAPLQTELMMFDHPVLSHLKRMGMTRFTIEDLCGVNNRFSAVVELEAMGAIKPTSQHGQWVICGND